MSMTTEMFFLYVRDSLVDFDVVKAVKLSRANKEASIFSAQFDHISPSPRSGPKLLIFADLDTQD
jgi:hypothetical protein